MGRGRTGYQARDEGGLWSALAANPRPFGAIKLSGRDDHRVRVGDYRIIYEIDDAGKRVVVTAIQHQKDAY